MSSPRRNGFVSFRLNRDDRWIEGKKNPDAQVGIGSSGWGSAAEVVGEGIKNPARRPG